MILLTGASGFIGKRLLSALIKVYGSSNVLALTSKPITECPYLLHHNYTFSGTSYVDNDYAGLIDTVIHAGAFTPKSSQDANDIFSCNSNIVNTAALIENLPNSVKRIIFLSTLDIYAQTDCVIDEFSLISPVSLYGQSKLYCEKMLEAWGKKTNKIVQILRIGHVYGPGEEAYQKIIPATMKKIAKGDNVEIWGTGDELRTFIYIDDVVKAIIRSINAEHFAGPVNLVGDNSISIKDLVNKIISITSKKVMIQAMPSHSNVRNLIFDNSKMKQYLGSAETALEVGLAKEWQHIQGLIS